MVALIAATALAGFLAASLVMGVQIVGTGESLPVTLGVGAASLLLLGVFGLFIWNEVHVWLT